jgi:thiamine pyrophosphate-dependent acetolactate synthase large subunit-like protein
MAKTTSDLIVERLLEWGVDTYFGLPGDGINGFFESLRTHQDRVRFIRVRHEEAGALAAVGYAKFTGRPAVCVSTSGPGAIHMLNGLYDAKMDEAPLIAITGMQYHDVIGTRFLQDINQDYVFNDACWFNQRVMGPAHAVNVTDLAVRSALGHRGPSHIAIPVDIQSTELSEEAYSVKNPPGHTSVTPQPQVRVAPREEIERAAEVLKGRRNIAICAGQGARGAGEELEQVAEALGAPIVKAGLGKDVVPDDSPYTTGGLGLIGTRPSQEVFENCDGFLIVGTSTPYYDFWPQPGQADAVQIDDNPDRIGLRYPVEVGLVGDARATLQELLPLLERNEDRSFLERAQEGMREWSRLMEAQGTSDSTPMKPQVVPWHLPELLRDDAIVCGDSGAVTAWVSRMPLKRGQSFSFSGTNCSMAAGLPYAIGAQVAHPDRQVVVFTGDGCMSMLMGDLATLAHYELPVKVVVLNNNSLGLIVWEQMAFLGNPQYGCDIPPINFAKVAEACGLKGVRIEDPLTCREQLEEGLSFDGPALIEAVVDPDEPPFGETLKPVQAQNIARAFERGEGNRERMASNLLEEDRVAVSPAVQYAKDELSETSSRGDGAR